MSLFLSPPARLPRRLAWLVILQTLACPCLARGQSTVTLDARRETAAGADLVSALSRAATASPTTAAGGDAGGSTPGGAEFGEQRILQRHAQVDPWSAVVDLQVFHTDNAGLTSVGRESDSYMRYGAAVSYTNRIAGPLFIDLSLQQAAFRYSEFDVLDFDLSRAEAGLLFQTAGRLDLLLVARYRFERIMEADWGSALLTTHSAELGVQKIWKIRRGQRLSAGLFATLPFETDPRPAERFEYSASLGYSLRLTERLTAGLSYRGSRYHAPERGRSDWNHLFSGSASYALLDWLQLGLNVTYTVNRSDAAVGNYESFVPGASVALKIVF